MSSEAGLFIEGKALDTTGFDRDQERFLESAVSDAAISAFMRNPVLAYHHATSVAETVNGPSKYVQLGVVTELERRPDGVYMKAWVPRPQHGGFLANIYQQIATGAARRPSRER